MTKIEKLKTTEYTEKLPVRRRPKNLRDSATRGLGSDWEDEPQRPVMKAISGPGSEASDEDAHSYQA